MDGRSSGIPDLSRLSAEAHRDYDEVMLKGSLAAKGMGSFAGLLSAEEIEAIHVYLIDLAWQNYATAQAAGQSRQATAPHTPKPMKGLKKQSPTAIIRKPAICGCQRHCHVLRDLWHGKPLL
jgi:hypothetical protein